MPSCISHVLTNIILHFLHCYKIDVLFGKVKSSVCFCEMDYQFDDPKITCDRMCNSNEICGGDNEITVLDTGRSKTHNYISNE